MYQWVVVLNFFKYFHIGSKLIQSQQNGKIPRRAFIVFLRIFSIVFLKLQLFQTFITFSQTGKTTAIRRAAVRETIVSGGGTFRRRRLGAGLLGAEPFRRRTFRRRFLIYFSIYEEKTMKQAIS